MLLDELMNVDYDIQRSQLPLYIYQIKKLHPHPKMYTHCRKAIRPHIKSTHTFVYSCACDYNWPRKLQKYICIGSTHPWTSIHMRFVVFYMHEKIQPAFVKLTATIALSHADFNFNTPYSRCLIFATNVLPTYQILRNASRSHAFIVRQT